MRGCSCRGTSGVVHLSCLEEQAKILLAEAEENRLGGKTCQARWSRWHTCSLCEQQYHGIVSCALSWACWRTYLGRPERSGLRRAAMTQLGNGLAAALMHEAALSVQEAELSMLRRFGVPELTMLDMQCNIANTYQTVGRSEQALELKQHLYSRRLELHGEEHEMTLVAATNYAVALLHVRRFEEAKSLSRKKMPVLRRVLGEGHYLTLQMRMNYAMAFYQNSSATLDDTREAITTLEDAARIARRVLGGAHPITKQMEEALRDSQAALEVRSAGHVYSCKIRFLQVKFNQPPRRSVSRHADPGRGSDALKSSRRTCMA